MIFSIATDGFLWNSNTLLIGVRTLATMRIWKIRDFPSEGEMIKDFMKFFTHMDDKIVIGFNILKFDLPLLLLKAKNLEGFEQFFRKINMANVEDLFIFLTILNEGKLNSLDFYCRHYGIEPPPSDRDIMRWHSLGEYEKSESAFEKKLETINTLFQKIWADVKGGKWKT